MRICPFCGDNVVGNHTDCRMNQPTAEQHATEADIDAARDIVAEGRASHAGWAEHLKRCPGCEQCKTLGIDWGWEREQSWVERYDFLLGVIDSFAALRQRHAEVVAENSDLRALLDEARSHNPDKYRSSSDDSGTRGAETGGELLPPPSSDWTRVAPSGEGSGQPIRSARQRAEEVLAFRDAYAPDKKRFHERALLVDNGERGSEQKAVIFAADDLAALLMDLRESERRLSLVREVMAKRDALFEEATAIKRSHAEAVEAAFREGARLMLPRYVRHELKDEIDLAWIASEAKARLT